ncbi:PQQ-binding-like beta-propeller repeat protein [Streptomyces sp. NPDC058291]|uniref:serine/threonine-protein kinase n=1 Tax=Streptomyces sp. NPDC058291 TaxID=3346427 RepID=UPI0036E15755
MSLHKDDPKALGGYRIVDRLGAGGMGVVYRGRSRSGREVAVKVVHAQYAEDPVFRARFRQEIEAVRKVSGAFTAPVVDADPEAARPWMATQYVPGPALSARIRDHGPLRGEELRRLVLGLVEALREIHRAGVVHRDLKPGNVLMADDGPRVIDFGISRAAENQTLTETGHMIGTPPFMSPEQLRDARSVGPASDVFSLGALLTYAATGRGPFDTDSPYLTAWRVINEAPQLDRLPPALRGILSRCLAKSADERPTLDELSKELEAVLPEGILEDPAAVARCRPDPVAEPAAIAAPAARSRRRLFALAGTAAVLAVALTVAFVLGLPNGGGSDADGSPSPTRSSRWAAVPTGWKPWNTTVRAAAESGVTGAPGSAGDAGTPTCALSGDALYCTGPGALPVRIDVLTGRIRWRADIAPTGPSASGYEGQLLGVRDGVVLVRRSALTRSENDPRTVDALDADTGRRLWSEPLTARNGTPGLAGGLALVPDPDSRTVTARSLRRGTRLWSAPLPADHACSFHDLGKGLYAVCSRFDGGSPGTRLISLNPADGATRPLAKLAAQVVPLGEAEGRLVFLEESETSRESSGDQTYARAVLVNPTSGARDTVPLAGEPGGQVSLTEGLLCFAAFNGVVTAVSPMTGEQQWRTRTTLEQPGQPITDERGATVFLASVSGRLAALDSGEGTVLWESLPHSDRATNSGWVSTLFRRAGALVAVTPDGTVFSADPARPDSTPAPS